MFILYLSSMTPEAWSSLSEICMLISFCLWIASQYNVWGKVYVVYYNSPNYVKLGSSMKNFISQKINTKPVEYGSVVREQIFG